jgi:DNA-binding transcriptional ArsR family regulator
MRTGLFGNSTAEKTLLYLERYQEGYALEIARAFELPVSQVQRQLLRLEASGILVSQKKGKTRIFYWNPRCYFLTEIRSVLEKILEFLPRDEQAKYFLKRTRPRRTGKPL